MGASIQIPQPGEHIQRTRRGYSDDFTDQHGRHFAAQYELTNSRPIGELTPVGHHPPWLPPMRYMVWERPNGGFRFRWDYETMANDLSETAVSYYQQVFEFMTEHMPGVEPPEVGEPVPTKVLRSPIGKPPLSPAIPLACMAGEPWMLGIPGADVNTMLRDVLEQSSTSNGRAALNIIRERMKALAGDHAIPTRPNEADTPLAPKKTIHDADLSNLDGMTYKEFLASAMKGGRMSMADAAVAWAEHRRNLVAA